MKNLQNFGVQELDANEVRKTDGGWVIPVIRTVAKILAAVAGYNEVCGGCVTDRIANSDSSTGGSRPFE